LGCHKGAQNRSRHWLEKCTWSTLTRLKCFLTAWTRFCFVRD